LNLSAISLENYLPFTRVTVVALGYAGEAIAAYDSILGEPVIRVDESTAEGERNDHFVLLRSVRRGHIENLQDTMRSGRDADRQRNIEVAPDARASRVNGNLDDLNAMAVTDPCGDLALESGAYAACPDRIINEITRLRLANANRRES